MAKAPPSTSEQRSFKTAVAAYGRGELTEAASGFRTLAEAGNTDAQFNLALMYMRGEGVPKDAVEAVHWYRRAAAQGNPNAQLNLGACYVHSTGVREDLAEAARWYHCAAEQGDADSQYNLAMLYVGGRGVPYDVVEAYAWADVAAAQGYDLAYYFREIVVVEYLIQDRIDEARKRSREYWTNYVVPFR